MSGPLLPGRVIAITGAASGIGRASAERFAAEGARLALFDASEGVHEIARSIGGDSFAMVGDAGDDAAVARLVGDTIARFGRIDGAFANAGISGGLDSIFEQTPEAFAEVLRINVTGPFLLIRHAGKAMWDRGEGGAILVTASVAGLRSGAGGPAYSASKAGAINLVRVAAQQLSGTGVRVNALCPGLTQTGMTQMFFDRAEAKGHADKLGQMNPLRRAAQPAELASVAAFLMSDEASYVNGEAIVVDGGLTSSHPFRRQDTGRTAV